MLMCHFIWSDAQSTRKMALCQSYLFFGSLFTWFYFFVNYITIHCQLKLKRALFFGDLKLKSALFYTWLNAATCTVSSFAVYFLSAITSSLWIRSLNSFSYPGGMMAFLSRPFNFTEIIEDNPHQLGQGYLSIRKSWRISFSCLLTRATLPLPKFPWLG